MNKLEILKAFLDKNLQADRATLEFFEKNPDKLDVFFSKIANKEMTSITLDTAQKILTLDEAPRIQILNKNDAALKKTSVGEAIDFFNKRYLAIKKMFDKKQVANMLSINKIGPRAKEFSVIAIVKEKDISERSLLIEDQTADVRVYFDDNLSEIYDKILPDEVICLVCSKDDHIEVKKLLWPDIPITHEANKTDNGIECFFISDFHMDDKNFNEAAYKKFLTWIEGKVSENFLLFVLGDISSDANQTKNFFAALPEDLNYFFVEGEIDKLETASNLLPPNNTVKISNVILFLSHGDFLENYKNIWRTSLTTDIMLNLLKKRHLNPVFDFNKKIYDDDPFILSTVPDVLVCGHLHEPGILNYKGVTIISNGSFITKPIYWMINLKTRETFKIDFT